MHNFLTFSTSEFRRFLGKGFRSFLTMYWDESETFGDQEHQKVDQERESGGHGGVEMVKMVTSRKSE